MPPNRGTNKARNKTPGKYAPGASKKSYLKNKAKVKKK
jgi:hypothetical protein